MAEEKKQEPEYTLCAGCGKYVRIEQVHDRLESRGNRGAKYYPYCTRCKRSRPEDGWIS